VGQQVADPTPVLFGVFTSLELTRMAQPEQKPCALLFVHCVLELQGRAVYEPQGHPLHDHPPTQSGKNDITSWLVLDVERRNETQLRCNPSGPDDPYG
jgi:hypothetical protein